MRSFAGAQDDKRGEAGWQKEGKQDDKKRSFAGAQDDMTDFGR